MKEENNGASKNKWSRIFRKKWFFPALYLTVAAVLLTVVVWYQNLDDQVQEADDEQLAEDNYTQNPYDQEAQPVVDQQEVVKMPVENPDHAEIVTKFFDYNADQEDQELALVHYNNRYYQSTGIDIANPDAETFNVTAALSGTVSEVKEDPLLGNLVKVEHENEVMTYYASLGKVDVKEGDKVKQGDVIGTAGKNVFGKDKGVHVHFEIRKDGKPLNPETYFNQPVSKLKNVETEDSNATDDSNASEESSQTEDSETTEQTDATDNPDASEDSNETDESDDTTDQENSDESSNTEDSSQDETDSTDGNSTSGMNEPSASSANA